MEDLNAALWALAGCGSVALLVGAGAMILKAFPTLATTVLGESGGFGKSGGRSGDLDGLRGVLSLLVVLHHSILVHFYCATGRYEPAPGNFDNMIGEGAVALFFITTGYLYWGRLLNGASFDWRHLLVGRLRRLVPMYVLSVLILVAIVMAECGFTLRVPAGELLSEIGRWLSFTFLQLPDINGLAETGTIQVVLWTLRYEWQFVLCLPVLALFARGRLLPLILYGGGLAAAFTWGEYRLYAYFVGGLVAAHLRARQSPLRLPDWVWAAMGVAALAVLPTFYHHIYGLPQVGLLTLIFLGATSGTGPWVVLRLRPLRFLGLISYSVYLLHHMVLHLVASRIYGAERFGALHGWQMQGAVLMVGATAIILATLTFLTVERPWMHPAAARPL